MKLDLKQFRKDVAKIVRANMYYCSIHLFQVGVGVRVSANALPFKASWGKEFVRFRNSAGDFMYKIFYTEILSYSLHGKNPAQPNAVAISLKDRKILVIRERGILK